MGGVQCRAERGEVPLFIEKGDGLETRQQGDIAESGRDLGSQRVIAQRFAYGPAVAGCHLTGVNRTGPVGRGMGNLESGGSHNSDGREMPNTATWKRLPNLAATPGSCFQSGLANVQFGLSGAGETSGAQVGAGIGEAQGHLKFQTTFGQ